MQISLSNAQLTVPDDVTILLADDNWGNLMAVLPWGDNHTAGGGIYYRTCRSMHGATRPDTQTSTTWATPATTNGSILRHLPKCGNR